LIETLVESSLIPSMTILKVPNPLIVLID